LVTTCPQHRIFTSILQNQNSKPPFSLVALYGDWNIFSQVNGSQFLGLSLRPSSSSPFLFGLNPKLRSLLEQVCRADHLENAYM